MATRKQPSTLDVLTDALVSATNLQRVLDAPRDEKMNKLGFQYKQLSTAFGLAQNADDIANLNNKLNNINKENIYAEMSIMKDIANMEHRNKAEEYRLFEDSFKQISTTINGIDFPQTQEDYRANMSDWAEVYSQENPNDKRPVMKSIFKKYKEFEKTMRGIMAQDADGNWSLINPNFKYNKSGSGLTDNEMLEQFIKYGQRLENYLGFALADDTITDTELMAGMEEEFESWYYDETEKIKKQSGKDINYHMKQIDTLNNWKAKQEEDPLFSFTEMSGTEIGESIGITDNMSDESAIAKINKQIEYHEWAIENSKQQVYKWSGKPIEEYETPTSGMYQAEQEQDIIAAIDDFVDDFEGKDFSINNLPTDGDFLSIWNDPDTGHTANLGNMNASVRDVLQGNLNRVLEEFNPSAALLEPNKMWGRISKELDFLNTEERQAIRGQFVQALLNTIEGKDDQWISSNPLAIEEELTNTILNQYSPKISEEDQAFFDSIDMQDIQEKVNANIDAQAAGEDLPFAEYGTSLEEAIKNEHDAYNFTNSNVVDENTTWGQFLTKYLPFIGETEPGTEIVKTGGLGAIIFSDPEYIKKWNEEPGDLFKFAGEDLTNTTKDLIGNKIPLYDANGNFNPKFAEKVPKINLLFDSRTKKWATLPDGSLYIMDSQTIPPKSVLRQLGIRLPKGISPDSVEGEKFFYNKWKKYPHLVVREVDMMNFGKDYPTLDMLRADKGRFKGIQNLSLYGNQYAEGASPKKWKKLKGVGKFAKGFVGYNVLTALSGTIVEGATDDEVVGEIASQSMAVFLDVAALTKSPKFLKRYRKQVNEAFKEVSEKFIQSTEATKATKKKFIDMAQKVGKSKTTKFAMAFAKKLTGTQFRNKFAKSVAKKLTIGLLGKLGISAATLGTAGTVVAIGWTAYDVFELGHMVWEAYKEVEDEQAALDAWNEATK